MIQIFYPTYILISDFESPFENRLSELIRFITWKNECENMIYIYTTTT